MHGTVNVFKGIHKNPLFIGIVVVTSCLQVIIVQFGSLAFAVQDGGLSLRLWGYSVMFGAFGLLWQQVINIIYRIVSYGCGK
jgi:Cation transporting ATPase, C-terminus